MPNPIFVVTLQDAVGVILVALGGAILLACWVADKIMKWNNRRNKNG